ncbi:MAG: hypothetical protein RLZZ224_1959 [Verrucomicrobiota bacterium]|jgi:mitochondrial fission protein ELM1
MSKALPELMNILWLKDTKTGHLHKAKGLLRALSDKAAISITECDVQWRWSGLRAVLPRLGPWTMRLPLHWLFKNIPNLSGCDMILSAGGATQWLNAAIAYQHKITNVFLGSPRGMDVSLFSCIAFHDAPIAVDPCYRFTIIPSLVTPQGAALAARQCKLPESSAWGLLFGGDGEGIVWTKEEYRKITQSFLKAAAHQGVKVAIATSRRTPPAIEAMVRELAASSGRLEVSCWYHNRSPDAPPLLAMLGGCSRLYVTADSMSMTHEAVSSGRPVYVILPPSGGNTRLLANLSQLQKEKHILLQQSSDMIDQANAVPEGNWNIIEKDPTAALAAAVFDVYGRHVQQQKSAIHIA